MIDLIGYASAALVIVSVALHRYRTRRFVSIVGAAGFATYGVLTQAWPVVATAGAVGLLMAWHLARELRADRAFGIVPQRPDSPFIVDFIANHLDDIQKTQPNFTGLRTGDIVYVYLRDGMPAGALVGSRSDDRLNVHLDYVMAPFRDTRIAQWLYDRGGAQALRSAGFRELAERPATDDHRSFLLAVGFVPEGDRLVKRL